MRLSSFGGIVGLHSEEFTELLVAVVHHRVTGAHANKPNRPFEHDMRIVRQIKSPQVVSENG